MRNLQTRLTLLFITVLTAFAVFVVWPDDPDRYLPDGPWPSGTGINLGEDFDRTAMKLGLDLRGGTHVVLQADTTQFDGDLERAMESAKSVIENRVNAFGVAETEIQRQGKDRLSVQLPGVDPDEAAELIGRTAVLEFREPKTNEDGLIAVTVPGPPLDESTEDATDDEAQIDEGGAEGTPEEATPEATEEASAESTTTPSPTAEESATASPTATEEASATPTATAEETTTPEETATPEATASPEATPSPDATVEEPQTHEEFVDAAQIGTSFSIQDVVWELATGVVDGREVPLTGRLLSEAEVNFDQLGEAFITLNFNDDGGAIFEQITGRLAQAGNLPLAIFLDEEILTAPQVNEQIGGGEAQITGQFSLDEANRIVAQLNAGALPVPLRVIQQNEVDATLGDDTVVKTVEAGLIAMLIVMFFMALYYRLPGVMAGAALLVYASIVLMLFKLIPVTLTLAGIAAFVLSIGIAVDANILIFERMKEELRLGRRLREAISVGWDRAWPSIRDSNASTLITCVILYFFGDAFDAALVKGFAIALAIGVLVSMFTAIVVTRTFLNILVGTRFSRNRWLFGVSQQDRQMAVEGAEHPDIELKHRPGGRWLDFVGNRRWFYLASLLVLIPGIVSLMIPPRLQPGIEFSSGTTFTVDFKDDVSQEDLRSAMADLGHPEARIQGTSEGDFLVRTEELEGSSSVPPVGPALPSEVDEVKAGLADRFGDFQSPCNTEEANCFLGLSTVSSTVSREIGRNAAFAVVAASLAILGYITLAFRSVPRPFAFGAAAVIALVHDAVLVLGVFSILGKLFDTEINTLFITGLLTVIGFSVHDSIVVFDRIRENLERRVGEDFATVVNDSLLETVARSITTSLTVVLTIVAMLLLGGQAIREFLLVLLIGIISGTYSSVFVASQLLVSFDRGDFTGWLSNIRGRERESEPAASPGG
ncbi:MAG: protein translocase subunit SecD [Dehalococcoidia bacterium]